MPTLFPTTRVSPLGAHANVTASPRPLTSLVHVFPLASQNLATPSLLKLHSSASFTGLKATFSMAAEWPFSSVEKRTFGFSGFPGASQSVLEVADGEIEQTYRRATSCPWNQWQQVFLWDSKQSL